MKVKMIKDFKINTKWIRKDEELEVRIFPTPPFQFNPPFQVIEGLHSGEIIPKEYWIKVPCEKTYTEKEWNDMENYYMNKLDVERENIDGLLLEKKRLENEIDEVSEYKKVELPLEVYEAFTKLEREWKKYLDKESIDLLLLTLMSVHAVGDALVLKKFALENATTYLRAILHGYSLSEEDISKFEVRRWYKGALIREADKIDPDGFAKEAIEEVALYLGGAEILADLSPFCKNQLSMKKVN